MRIILLILIIGILALAGCASQDNGNPNEGGVKVTLYKSPSCGCCVGYGAELKSRGFNVETISADMPSIKQQYNIPAKMQSCHTAIIGNYFVEGHVPFEAVNKLLDEKPEIDGIALPGMPSGSPGMPGTKRESFTVYALTNGNAAVFMKV